MAIRKKKASGVAPIEVRPATRVVGVGASAGGLEALSEFFGRVPARTGMAFVVVQHLDPTRKGMLPELLARTTRLPVLEATDGLPVEADHVYVIPPNKDLALVHGVLHLLSPAAPRGQRLPIDFFFHSLADDLREQSIGVILSGMGADGTAGLRAIHERSGAGFAQSPSSARFDAMPRSAIDARVVDVVAPAGELPSAIVEFVRHAPAAARPDHWVPDAEARGTLEKIVGLLRSATGHDLSMYKPGTLYRRVERRMGLHRIARMDDYVRFLRENPGEVELLWSELLIGVTRFFRDPDAWDELQQGALRGLLAEVRDGGCLRAWVPACSTGEEAYSLAIALQELLDVAEPRKNVTLQIYATDIDAAAIARARRALYPLHIASELSAERLKRFFVEDSGGYRLRREVRERVVFATHNALQDPPFTRLDVVSCRNLLIYLTVELQQRLIALFHYSLRPDGLLLLGNAETVGNATERFAPVGGKARLYRRLPSASTDSALALRTGTQLRGDVAVPAPSAPSQGVTRAASAMSTLIEQHLVRRFGPAAVLVSPEGDVLYLTEPSGRFLELPVGKANWNVLAMAREGLREALVGALHRARRSEEAVEIKGIVQGTRRSRRTVDMLLEPITEPAALRGTVLIVLTDGAVPPRPRARNARGRQAEHDQSVDRLSEALREAREELWASYQQMQASHEELQSTNEELQSTNEELQSTNEELTTSREEMQSMNEELQTLNQELQTKVDELSSTAGDMKNLLESTGIAVVFLDAELRVRRFTREVASLIKLIPGDVGRPLADLVSDLEYPALQADAREVLRTLVFREKAIESHDGRRYQVRIMPYRTLDNRIDGVVITFTLLNTGRAAGAT